MVGWALYHGHFAFATSLLVCFYGTLRTGELLDITRNRVEISSKLRTAVIALGLTKAEGSKKAFCWDMTPFFAMYSTGRTLPHLSRSCARRPQGGENCLSCVLPASNWNL